MKHGTISLEYNDETVSSKYYDGPLERFKIIQKWRRQYGERFFKCAIVIAPHTDDLFDDVAVDNKKEYLAIIKAPKMTALTNFN